MLHLSCPGGLLFVIVGTIQRASYFDYLHREPPSVHTAKLLQVERRSLVRTESLLLLQRASCLFRGLLLVNGASYLSKRPPIRLWDLLFVQEASCFSRRSPIYPGGFYFPRGPPLYLGGLLRVQGPPICPGASYLSRGLLFEQGSHICAGVSYLSRGLLF